MRFFDMCACVVWVRILCVCVCVIDATFRENEKKHFKRNEMKRRKKYVEGGQSSAKGYFSLD